MAAVRTLACVAGGIRFSFPFPASTLETVDFETPAALATSLIETDELINTNIRSVAQ